MERHMPFKYDDSHEEDVITLVQRGFITRYSKRRKTPIFTAQKLDGAAYKLLKDDVMNLFNVLHLTTSI